MPVRDKFDTIPNEIYSHILQFAYPYDTEFVQFLQTTFAKRSKGFYLYSKTIHLVIIRYSIYHEQVANIFESGEN